MGVPLRDDEMPLSISKRFAPEIDGVLNQWYEPFAIHFKE